MKITKLYLNYAGYCVAKSHHAVKGAKKKDIKFAALFGLIQHPNKGWVLFDTGYTDRFFEATRNYPSRIYAHTTKVYIQKHEELKQQLYSFGIKSEEINHIIISHFHADHIGGLKDFENATIYCSKEAFDQAKNIPSFLGFSKGILKSLIPSDIEKRLSLIEDFTKHKSDPLFGEVWDLFDDESIMVYQLPGHAKGQIGIQLQTEKSKYFLIADACWDSEAFLNNKLPHPIVKLFFHSWKNYKETIRKLTAFHTQNPEVIIIPTHCEKTTKRLVNEKIDLNAL